MFNPVQDVALLMFDNPSRAFYNMLMFMNEFRHEGTLFMNFNLMVTVFSWTAAICFVQLMMFLHYHLNLLRINRTTNELIKIDRIQVEMNN